MIRHCNIPDTRLRALIKEGQIRFAGNLVLKIYGHLHCPSGKRMKRENRVFFNTGAEAEDQSFRPCGRCMKAAYQSWKKEVASQGKRP